MQFFFEFISMNEINLVYHSLQSFRSHERSHKSIYKYVRAWTASPSSQRLLCHSMPIWVGRFSSLVTECQSRFHANSLTPIRRGDISVSFAKSPLLFPAGYSKRISYWIMHISTEGGRRETGKKLLYVRG